MLANKIFSVTKEVVELRDSFSKNIGLQSFFNIIAVISQDLCSNVMHKIVTQRDFNYYSVRLKICYDLKVSMRIN